MSISEMEFDSFGVDDGSQHEPPERPCSKCKGRGYIDEGHLDDDGRMWSAPESCPECLDRFGPDALGLDVEGT